MSKRAALLTANEILSQTVGRTHQNQRGRTARSFILRDRHAMGQQGRGYMQLLVQQHCAIDRRVICAGSLLTDRSSECLRHQAGRHLGLRTRFRHQLRKLACHQRCVAFEIVEGTTGPTTNKAPHRPLAGVHRGLLFISSRSDISFARAVQHIPCQASTPAMEPRLAACE